MPEIEERVRRATTEKVFPGCVIGIVRADGTRNVMPFGRFTYESGSPPVREDTIYDLASVTKSIPLASLALVLMAEGKFLLDDPVKKFVPELHNDFDATVRDLMLYRVRGARLSDLRHKSADEIHSYIMEHGFSGPPGESSYANLPAYVLGLVVERAGGKSLPVLAEQYFFAPLGMDSTTFFPDQLRGRYSDISLYIAPTEIDDQEGEIRGIVHDESARVFSRANRAVGHAGLFSSAPDLLNFLETLISGDYPSIVEGARQGLGWQVGEPFLGSQPRERFGKTGFTGTSVVYDGKRGIGLVILSNRPYPKRPVDPAKGAQAMNAFRRDIANMIFH